MEGLSRWSLMRVSARCLLRLRRSRSSSLCSSTLGQSRYIFAPFRPAGAITINCLRIPLKANGYFIKQSANCCHEEAALVESLLRINRSDPVVMSLFADSLHVQSAALVFVSELSWPQCEKSANVGPPRLPPLPRCRYSVFALFDDSACARSVLAVAGHTHLARLSASFFTLDVHLYHASPAVVSFPSFHVGQICRDNLLRAAGSRCRRGVAQGARSISAWVALRSMNGPRA